MSSEIARMTREELQAGIARLRDRMERLGLKKELTEKLLAKQKGENTNGHSYPLVRLNGGARFTLPEGKSVDAIVDDIIRLQNEHHLSLEDIAPRFQLALHTVRKLRNIILLARRDDLTPEEFTKVQEAVNQLNLTRRVAKPWKAVEPIALRVWGKRADTKKLNPVKRRSNPNKRWEQFENAISFLANSAESAVTIDIPRDIALSRAHTAITRLESARKSLEKLKTRIRREVQREY